MMWFTPLPPLVYEILNCMLFAGLTCWLVLVLRYLATAYVAFRNERFLTHWESFAELRKLRVAIGIMVFLCGESPRMGYVWLVRYLANTGHDASWLSSGHWIFFPVATSYIAVFGCACSVRAIIPEVWGRYAYSGTLLVVSLAVLATMIIR